MQQPRQSSWTKVNLWLDLALTIAVLALLSPSLTGLAIHEWLGVGFAVAIVAVTASGLMISRVALPAAGLAMTGGGFWRGLHSLSANASLLLVGLHVAVHWQWIVNAVRQYLVAPWRTSGGRPAESAVAGKSARSGSFT